MPVANELGLVELVDGLGKRPVVAVAATANRRDGRRLVDRSA